MTQTKQYRERKEKPYNSVLHKNCGGEIVLVANDLSNAILACNKCKQNWETSSNAIPFPQKMAVGEDMYIYNQPEIRLKASDLFD